jgi:hypothetical protein
MTSHTAARACLGLMLLAALASAAAAAATHEVWIAARSDGRDGSGSQADPRDGSTAEKFDGILAHYRRAQATNLTIRLWPGVYRTRGDAAWTLSTGWRLIGSGAADTTLTLAGVTRPDTVVIAATGGGAQEVCDLTLDCNYRNLPWDRGVHNIAGIRLQGPGSAIRCVRVLNAGGDGGDFTIAGIAGNPERCQIESCVVEEPATAFGNETGISLGSPRSPDRPGQPVPAGGGKLLNNSVAGCRRAYTADGARGLVVANNRATACGYGWYQSAPVQADVTIAHNEFTGCTYGGIIMGEGLAEGRTEGVDILGNTIEVETRGTALGLFNRQIRNVRFRFNRVKTLCGPAQAISIAPPVGRVALEDNVFALHMVMDIRSTNATWSGNRGPAGLEVRGVEDHVSRGASEGAGVDLSPLLPATDPQDPPRQEAPLEAELGRNGEILDWLVLGPFPHPGRPFPAPGESAGGAAYPFDFMLNVMEMGQGESTVKARTGASVKVLFPTGADATTFWTEAQLKPRRIAWQRVHADGDRGVVDVTRVPNLGGDLDNTCIYAACHLQAAADMPVRFKFGSDDGFVLFVNGQRVGEVRDDRRTLARDMDTVEADLRSGDNLVVVKLCNAVGSFAMCVRLTDRNDQPIRGVTILLP